MKAGFIGAGKVGFTLGKYLADHGICVTGYYSRHGASAAEAAEFTKSRYYEDLESITLDSDTLFITVPDGTIRDIWDDMRNLPIENKNICHCSGRIPSTVFFDAEEKGAYRYAVHPLYAISHKYESYKTLQEAFFTIEGSEKRLPYMKGIFQGFGNRVVTIDAENKNLYHAAAAVVSNQVVALFDLSAQLLIECGFDRQDAEEALKPLFLGNAKNICKAGPMEALTGPVERADSQTVAAHMQGLAEEERELYRLLSKRLLKIAKEKHAQRNFDELEKELEK